MTKIAGGGAGIAWIFLYAALAWSILNGFRACLAYKRVSAGSASVDTF